MISVHAARLKTLQTFEKGLQKPSDIFSEEKDQYSQFDELGIPTHDKDGVELAKKARKKLQSRYEKQAESFSKTCEKLKENPNLITDLEKEIKDLESQLTIGI